MNFRPDIQGLRALAVLGVFLFHLDIAAVSGGYVGVDIFFVISGYLITGILVRDMQAGRFSFAEFYVRRMKRILPAVQLVGLVTLVAGWLLLLPTSLLSLAKSLIATSLFASNIYFWYETGGYFSPDSHELPMLHFWSLSVEEQFYLLWPLTLLLLCRLRTGRKAFLVASAIACSFMLAQWAIGFKATAAYFLLPTRAGEFLLGALLVFIPERRLHSNLLVTQSAALVGIALLLGSNILLDEYSRFPGINAFWPCLGAALLIESSRQRATMVSRVLATRPLVFVGTISYSLYLWHWPPIAFLHYFGVPLAPWIKSTIFFGVFLLAYLSWRYVEETLRYVDWRMPRPVLAFACVPLVLQLGILAAVGHTQANFPGLGEVASVPGNCPEQLPADAYPDKCRLGDPHAVPSFVLWGDSYAGTLSPAIHERARSSGDSGYLFALSMCPSITSVIWDEPRMTGQFSQKCARYNDQILDFVLATPSVQTVVLTSNYFWYLTGKNEFGRPILAATDRRYDVPAEFRIMLDRLSAAGKHIVIVMPHPSDKAQFNFALRHAFVVGRTAALTIPRPIPVKDGITTMVEHLPPRYQVDRIYPDALMCDVQKCRVFDADGALFLSDGAHLTPKTAHQVVGRFPPDWVHHLAAHEPAAAVHERHSVHHGHTRG